MSAALSANTKAILLLTAPLIAGRSKKSADLLTPGEYKKLAKHLVELGGKPGDLLTSAADQLLGDCHRVIDKARLERLLGRGFLLSQAVERWQARAIWVISRADAPYPRRLKTRVKEDSPPLLYGCGEREILCSGGLAVVGSRHVDDALTEYAHAVGRLAASARRTLVSGGARGIDQAAMRGALEAGGRAIGVLADGLETSSMNREHRNLLLEGQLVLISPYDPAAGFNVGHAMQRNKVVYALADAALVVSAELDKGGTWSGAIEQLDKWRFIPVYVRSTGATSKGLEALRKKGALPWPNPHDEDELNTSIAADGSSRSTLPGQDQLSFTTQPDSSPTEVREGAPVQVERTGVAPDRPDQPGVKPADELLLAVRSLIVRVLRKPKRATEIATELGVTQRQADEWLKQLTREGMLEKTQKPARYSIRHGLFSVSRSSGSAVDVEPSGSEG